MVEEGTSQNNASQEAEDYSDCEDFEFLQGLSKEQQVSVLY